MPFLAADDFGNLAIAEPFAPQVERLALRRRQLRDQLSQTRSQLTRLTHLCRASFTAGWHQSCLFTGLRCLQRLLAAGLPQVIDRPVATDAEQPRRQAIVERILRFAAQLQERMLHRVAGGIQIAAQQAQGVPQQADLILVQRCQHPLAPRFG